MRTQEREETFRPSQHKPWIKLPFLQDIIAENIDLPFADIATIAQRTLSGKEMHEALVYLVSHLYPIVDQAKQNADPKLRKKQKREKAKKARARREELDKHVARIVDEGIRKEAAAILNMTGKLVRAVHSIPASCFDNVADNQLVHQVMSVEEVIDLLIKYR